MEEFSRINMFPLKQSKFWAHLPDFCHEIRGGLELLINFRNVNWCLFPVD